MLCYPVIRTQFKLCGLFHPGAHLCTDPLCTVEMHVCQTDALLFRLLYNMLYIFNRLCCGRTFPGSRARAAMPFGCLTLGEKKDYNNPSEVADKYDLGQIVKSWVHRCWKEWGKTFERSAQNIMDVSFFLILTERSFVSYSGQRIGTPWKCTPVKSSTKRMEGKWGKLPRMR